jgi:hypothetical protein
MEESGLQREHTTIIRWVQQPTYPQSDQGVCPSPMLLRRGDHRKLAHATGLLAIVRTMNG